MNIKFFPPFYVDLFFVLGCGRLLGVGGVAHCVLKILNLKLKVLVF